MNNRNSRYVEALAKLYGTDDPHTCQQPGCRTVILKNKRFCLKHAPRKDDVFKHRKVRRGKR